jgi:ribosomal protein S3AE
VSEPVINQVTTKDGIKWRVCGLGYCIEHQQRWQAEVMFECMMVAKGLRKDKPAN